MYNQVISCTQSESALIYFITELVYFSIYYAAQKNHLYHKLRYIFVSCLSYINIDTFLLLSLPHHN